MHLTQEKLVGLVCVYGSVLSLVLIVIILDFWQVNGQPFLRDRFQQMRLGLFKCKIELST